jgi:long-subunit fatty acid transport protein
VSSERRADWIGTFDFGATYKLTPNIQLDAGLNLGLTRSADDANPFVGLTVRY